MITFENRYILFLAIMILSPIGLGLLYIAVDDIMFCFSSVINNRKDLAKTYKSYKLEYMPEQSFVGQLFTWYWGSFIYDIICLVIFVCIINFDYCTVKVIF